jgi:hypothetical protein
MVHWDWFSLQREDLFRTRDAEAATTTLRAHDEVVLAEHPEAVFLKARLRYLCATLRSHVRVSAEYYRLDASACIAAAYW